MTITVPVTLRRQLAQIASVEQITLDDLVADVLREGVRAYGDKPGAVAREDGLFYRGPSLLTGAPIVGVLTGLDHVTLNAKTGPVLQTWILCADQAPMDAVRRNEDDAICGDCALRGDGGLDRRCYVAPWLSPNNIWRLVEAGRYREPHWPELLRRVEGHSLRLGAYGDPAAIPFEIWRSLLRPAVGWIGYTHQWRTCDPRFQQILMASVDSLAEWSEAQGRGWRTFRVLSSNDALLPGQECQCPASDEAGHRTTCERCQLCRGLNRPARSVAIRAHGHNGVRAAFHRREELQSCR